MNDSIFLKKNFACCFSEDKIFEKRIKRVTGDQQWRETVGLHG
jgi:hypothetical protein